MKLDSSVVEKPWGYEYLYYQNDYVGMWLLHIKGGHSTSMHCHPKKNTGLVMLEGTAEVSFLTSSQTIKSPNKLMIRRGLFHSTKALSANGIYLLEIEAPKDKRDLVRIRDNYGRANKPYESADKYYGDTRDMDLLDININDEFKLKCANQTLKVIKPSNENRIEYPDSCILVDLCGGLEAQSSQYVFQPGDVISGYTANLLQENFSYKPNTILLQLK